jgi:hypothetical protein
VFRLPRDSRGALAVLLLTSLFAGLAFLVRNRVERRPALGTQVLTTTLRPPPAPLRHERTETDGSPAPRSATVPRGLGVESERFRARILDSVRTRQPAPPVAGLGAGDSGPAAAGVADHAGDLAEEVDIIEREFMPLAKQCYDQARGRMPGLRGMLSLEVTFATDPEIGSIIESIEPTLGNQLGDSEFNECLRQSAFSLQFPAARAPGVSDRNVTLLFDTDAGAAARQGGAGTAEALRPLRDM